MSNKVQRILLAGAVLGTGMLAATLGQAGPWVEVFLIGVVLVPVVLHRPLRRLFGRIALRYRLVPIALVVLFLAGHLVLHNRSFPFVAWRMYGRVPQGDPVVYDYEAVLADGEHVPLVPSRLLPPLTAARLMSRLYSQANALRADPATETETLRHEHEATLAALGRLHDERMEGPPVDSVIVTSRRFHLGERSGSLQTSSDVLWSVAIR